MDYKSNETLFIIVFLLFTQKKAAVAAAVQCANIRIFQEDAYELGAVDRLL